MPQKRPKPSSPMWNGKSYTCQWLVPINLDEVEVVKIGDTQIDVP